MDFPGAMAAIATNNTNNNIINLSMANNNLSDMSANLYDSFNGDMSVLLDMS